MSNSGKKQIRAIFEDAKAQLAKPSHEWADPNLARLGFKPGQWPGAPWAMPPECPVQVVGRDAEGNVYCISATGHLRKMEKWDHPSIIGLFAPATDYAFWAFPAYGKKTKKRLNPETGEEEEVPPKIERLEVQKLATCLIQRAGELPDFDPLTQHRGRGGWVNRTGQFIWHSGEALYMKGSHDTLKSAKPAQLDDHLYTRQMPTITPWQAPVTPEESPAQRALEDLKTWNWQRPYLDPILLLGWIATSLMGGALPQRPIIFTTGGHGVGKSTLHELVKNLLNNVVFTAVDTTAAGIYQKVKHDALPFLVDELEAKSGSSKASSVIELARVAYTGGDIGRGSSDHEATTFKMHTSFFFSAINKPPMGSQDKSRMAVLNLGKLKRQEGPRQAPIIKDSDGRMLLRQVIDGWDYFMLELKPQYWEVLHAQGFDARQIDTYGTLLAAAELLVGPDALEQAGLPVRDSGRLGEILKEATALERNESLDNWHKCLNILFDSAIDAWRDGVKPTVGSVADSWNIGDFNLKAARDRLQLVNLGAMDASNQNIGLPGNCIAIPSDGPALMRIYENTEFYKGGWFDALKQAPDHIVIKVPATKQTVKIGGFGKRCLFIDLSAFARHTGAVD
ncbi:MAG: hypothetical protein ACRCU5_13935 [Rhizobiaceae bacterium]